MTKGTFGEGLKREREMRGVSLEEISAATRIATRFLQAIENEQWDQLPGGVFNRGFVRAVAHYLGLNEENIVAEYVLAVNDRQSVPVWTGSPPAVASEQPWAAWIVAAIILIALAAGVWFGTRRVIAWRAASRSAQSAPVAPPPSPGTPEMPPNPTPSAAPNGSSVSPDATAAAPSGNASSSQMTNATPPETPSSAHPVPDRINLRIEANKKTKVTVVADSDRVFDGTMKAGESRAFLANDRFEISARDAGALLLELNGKPLAPIGMSGHAGKVTVTRDALRGTQGGEN